MPLPGNVDDESIENHWRRCRRRHRDRRARFDRRYSVGLPDLGIEERVERETGYQLTIAGTTKISLWPSLNVTLSDITLQDPKDRDGVKRVTIGSVQADVALSSIWSGHPRVSELIITNPVVHVPLLRERTRIALATVQVGAPASMTLTRSTIDRVKIVGGAIVLANARDRVERRIDNINADVVDRRRSQDQGDRNRARQR